MLKLSRLFTLFILPLSLIAIFKLTLKGKFRLGGAADLIEVTEVKTGSFPAPANLVERKK